MDRYRLFLDWIDEQEKEMQLLLRRWSEINSGSENVKGIALMIQALKKAFSTLDASMQDHNLENWKKIDSNGNAIEVPLGKALSIRKRPSAPIQVFLGAHLDTVFPVNSPFQHCQLIDKNTLNGPGVADIKGGIMVMLKALEAFERSPFAENLGWEILFNPDEEIGSPGSAPLLRKYGKKHHIGLVFEPSLPNGALINQRKGSAIYTVVSKGKAAHVGREFKQGESAIVHLAKLIQSLDQLNSSDVILNIGNIEGGGPVNIVPDLAICRFNVRVDKPETMDDIDNEIKQLINTINKNSAGDLTLHGGFTRPPKTFDKHTEALFEAIRTCGKDLGLELKWQSSGGVCDGNILASVGLPTIDTLGVRGGAIHTSDEYVLLDSLCERARLVALFLMKLASKEITLDKEIPHESITC
ncbi:Uncharacterized protein SCG7109_BT_00030 [Chlamydiales bacterium SCGC AG-110-M15]|nr:Uncharacterized protein SCG7109_BT_00030 [Chlamydiales bacterium SCGC AG-110-M15]